MDIFVHIHLPTRTPDESTFRLFSLFPLFPPHFPVLIASCRVRSTM
jgi:hypothetical protein